MQLILIEGFDIAAVVLVELGEAVVQQHWGADAVGDVELQRAGVGGDGVACGGGAVGDVDEVCAPAVDGGGVFGFEVGGDEVGGHFGEVGGREGGAAGVVYGEFLDLVGCVRRVVVVVDAREDAY